MQTKIFFPKIKHIFIPSFKTTLEHYFQSVLHQLAKALGQILLQV